MQTGYTCLLRDVSVLFTFARIWDYLVFSKPKIKKIIKPFSTRVKSIPLTRDWYDWGIMWDRLGSLRDVMSINNNKKKSMNKYIVWPFPVLTYLSVPPTPPPPLLFKLSIIPFPRHTPHSFWSEWSEKISRDLRFCIRWEPENESSSVSFA